VNEEQWLVCEDPALMAEHCGSQYSNRKRRLYACACVRRLWPHLPEERSRRAVEVAERYADRLAGKQELTQACADALQAAVMPIDPASGSYTAIRFASSAAYCVARPGTSFKEIAVAVREANTASGGRELLAQARLFRCVFGNPFRPVALDPRWLTPEATGLALAAYDERALPAGTLDPLRLAVFADALEEAGCSEQVVAHLREPGPHVRGCWALDLILGKP
jgi:hypothetical protein